MKSCANCQYMYSKESLLHKFAACDLLHGLSLTKSGLTVSTIRENHPNFLHEKCPLKQAENTND